MTSLDVLHKEVAPSDVLRALVEPELVAEAECRCAVGDFVDVTGFVVVKVVRLY